MRTLVRSLMLGGIATMAGGGMLAAQDAEASEARTTAHAVYTEEQATRGEDIFFNICVECHFEDDFGGPFMQSWSGASVKALLEEIQATMPEDNPGGLPANQYIDVISFMFRLSGMPVGEAEMTEADLDDIDIDWRPSYEDPVADDAADDAAADTEGAEAASDTLRARSSGRR